MLNVNDLKKVFENPAVKKSLHASSQAANILAVVGLSALAVVWAAQAPEAPKAPVFPQTLDLEQK